MVTGGENGDVRLWDLKSREMISHLKEHTLRVSGWLLAVIFSTASGGYFWRRHARADVRQRPQHPLLGPPRMPPLKRTNS
jgi:hypothetical protein